MERRRLTLALAALTASTLGVSTAAHASIGIARMPDAVWIAAFNPGSPTGSPASTQCPQLVSPASGDFQSAVMAASSSKASAILGGQVSQLELIARQQATSPATTAPVQLGAAAPAGATIEPGLGRSDCFNFAAASSRIPSFAPAVVKVPLGGENFLASKRLPVRHTSFDNAWNRVRGETLPRKTAAALLAATGGRPDSNFLMAVNSWTNSHIRYVEDRVLYGQADYWADAASTLSQREGDCEDIAIVKMQLLAAMGVPRSDMYLTIARDLVRHADHAVLVVKLDGQNWLLDNTSDRVLDANASHDYRPIMSFSHGKKWLHGYSVAASALGQRLVEGPEHRLEQVG